MKKITLLLSLFFSLNFIAQSSANNFEQNIIGEWSISSITLLNEENGESVETSCNVCSKVVFTFDDREANIKRPDGVQELYLWSIDKDIIQFADISLRTTGIEDATFKGKYNIKLTQKEKYLELKIIDDNHHVSYTLTK